MAAGYNLIAPSAFSLHYAIYSNRLCCGFRYGAAIKKEFRPESKSNEFQQPFGPYSNFIN